MHKRIVNQATVKIVISPVGPLLIKAGDQGADPTKPDMEFVETYYAGDRSVYLPGSSLKGAIRAHCERIVRTLGGEEPNDENVWACFSVSDDKNKKACSERLDEKNKERKKQRQPELTGAEIYASSCTACQLFGNSSIASRVRITDAYPKASKEIQLEERNGVAIDRVYGSVAVGPFNFEVLTAGEFKTTITVNNFTTAQLALIALAIRDFDEQRVSIGFAKSRGLGQVNMKVNSVEIRYPTAVVENQQLKMIGNQAAAFTDNVVVGAGQLVDDADDYGFLNPDSVSVNVQAQPDDYGLGATFKFEASDNITALWRECVGSWGRMVKGG